MKQLLFVLYGITLVGFTIFSYAFVDQNLSYLHTIYSGFAYQQRLLTTTLYVGFIVLLFLFYGVFIYLFKKEKLVKKDVNVLIIISCIGFFFAYPAMLSYDIFNYVTTAKVSFFYHENPYLIMPIEFIGDPNLAFTRAANKVALYGPLWILITGIPFFFAMGNFFLMLMGFKLLNIIFYLATSFVIWKLRKNIFFVLLFALNPLVVIETVLSNHNDIVMMFFALSAMLVLKEKKYLIAICLFISSILIKYATLFLLPVFVYILLQSYKHKAIKWEKMYLFSALSMLVIFLFSPLREELYPWYALWFLPFAFLIPEKKILFSFSIAISFGLLLRYVPFMYLGTYFGLTPLIRNILMGMPVLLIMLYVGLKKNSVKKI